MIRLRKEVVVVEHAIGRREDGELGDTTIFTSCPPASRASPAWTRWT